MEKWLLVKQARSIMHMTQTELGELLDLGLNEISKWERNIIVIPDSRIHQLKDYYEQHTGDLVLFRNTISQLMTKVNKKGGKK